MKRKNRQLLLAAAAVGVAVLAIRRAKPRKANLGVI